MFWYRATKDKGGYILIHALLVGLLCILVSVGCYSMETIVKSYNMSNHKMVFNSVNIQKPREILITRLNNYISENIKDLSNENINEYFVNSIDFRIYYDGSYIYYDREGDSFKLEYVLNDKFYKEETYEYTVENNSVKYACIDYSFKK